MFEAKGTCGGKVERGHDCCIERFLPTFRIFTLLSFVASPPSLSPLCYPPSHPITPFPTRLFAKSLTFSWPRPPRQASSPLLAPRCCCVCPQTTPAIPCAVPGRACTVSPLLDRRSGRADVGVEAGPVRGG